jgi:predicted small secreted protein
MARNLHRIPGSLFVNFREKSMKTRNLSVWAMILGTLLSALTVTACNTVEGFGRDVEDVGDAIEDAGDRD